MQAEDAIRALCRSRGLGDVSKGQQQRCCPRWPVGRPAAPQSPCPRRHSPPAPPPPRRHCRGRCPPRHPPATLQAPLPPPPRPRPRPPFPPPGAVPYTHLTPTTLHPLYVPAARGRWRCGGGRRGGWPGRVSGGAPPPCSSGSGCAAAGAAAARLASSAASIGQAPRPGRCRRSRPRRRNRRSHRWSHRWIGPASYTHLRAPETALELVCRLLLEKKKNKKKKGYLMGIRSYKRDK